MADEPANCRICGAASPRLLGEVEYFSGFRWPIFQCADCGCRFTKHDNSVYDRLHGSGALSYYRDYERLAAKCRSLFERGDSAGLRALLCESSKYRFIIEAVERSPASGSVLEFGCSRGYLTSYFILSGRKIIGADVSTQAVQGARDAFGNSFSLAGAPAIREASPFDLIYHVGTIGCVEDPLRLTQELLSLLRPGGKLLFNAPNAECCYLQDQLWLDSAPPPDLVTLFPTGFWSNNFGNVAAVTEVVETRPADQCFEIGLRKLWRRRWQSPTPVRMDEARVSDSHALVQQRTALERALLKAARVSRAVWLASKQPSEFGLYVTMTKN